MLYLLQPILAVRAAGPLPGCIVPSCSRIVVCYAVDMAAMICGGGSSGGCCTACAAASRMWCAFSYSPGLRPRPGRASIWQFQVGGIFVYVTFPPLRVLRPTPKQLWRETHPHLIIYTLKCNLYCACPQPDGQSIASAMTQCPDRSLHQNP